MGITRREGSQNIQRHKPDGEAVMGTIRSRAVNTACVPAAGMQAAGSSPNQACVSPSKPQAGPDGELGIVGWVRGQGCWVEREAVFLGHPLLPLGHVLVSLEMCV